jgi:hypothetical protein
MNNMEHVSTVTAQGGLSKPIHYLGLPVGTKIYA